MQQRSQPINLSHHLSEVAKKRPISPLKGLQRFWGKPGIISLAGGLPSPEYFPFDALRGDGLPANALSSRSRDSNLSWIWNLFSAPSTTTLLLTVPKYPNNPGDINLASALQYGLANGLPQLIDFATQLTKTVFKPAYKEYAVTLHAGNTDGWAKAVTTLCNPGEGVLVSEWTFCTALATMEPYGIRAVKVGMDGEGMCSKSLREVLEGWNVEERGVPRPHVMYIIPVGQNPTGATMGAQRKQEIYDLCVKFDIIIVEDDPYYFLQQGTYTPPHKRKQQRNAWENESDEEYIASLVPSFLRFDYQGRVIRLDTFSKTIAPGARLGWYTCHPIFAERLERMSETSTQQPCGFGQTIITSLLLNWGMSGYFRWLKGIRTQYTERRDYLLDCFEEKFNLETCSSPDGSVPYAAYKKTSVDKTQKGLVLFSFVPPTSGMFVWLRMHFENHPRISECDEETLEQKLWVALAEAGLLLCPGVYFAANPLDEEVKASGHFRLSFSNSEFSELNKAVDILSAVTTKFFQIKDL
ncbi:pyridoxal phosphate-dependent transferase [Panaeolus papilionaceus]|nr:pyridoxal phosphate-dependent transferase [Panaeolus papilionaceus]